MKKTFIFLIALFLTFISSAAMAQTSSIATESPKDSRAKAERTITEADLTSTIVVGENTFSFTIYMDGDMTFVSKDYTEFKDGFKTKAEAEQVAKLFITQWKQTDDLEATLKYVSNKTSNSKSK